MTTRENKYLIQISFDVSSTSKIVYSGQVPYTGSMSFRDDFEIYNDKIILTAFRSAAVDLESIFYNHSSSLYNQIIKSLIFFYASTKKYIGIKSIKIERFRNERLQSTKEFESQHFAQVLNAKFYLDFPIEHDRLLKIMDNSASGQATLFALSYIFKAKCVDSESERFEKLWKAFNRLFFLIGGDTKDFTCLRNLRQFIIDNPGILKFSVKVIEGFDTAMLRNPLRWREMFLNNYPNESSVNGMAGFITRYHDKRIMEILTLTKYGYREDYLKNRGFFNDVEAHIKSQIELNVKNDEEIVSVLTGKYMYFVRNKSFHGEKLDSTFRLLVNKEDLELKFLNSVLEPYLIDLINVNNLY